MLSFNFLILLILILLLLVGTLVSLYFLIHRSRKISFTPDSKVKAEPESGKPEFLQYASDLELQNSFRRARRTLKSYVTGGNYRYRAPWYLMTGESDSGKTSVLDSDSLNVSATEPSANNSKQQLNWYFFNEGVVLDVAGDLVLRVDGTANHHGWNTILRLLQKHRPQRPLDGLVLTIPCTDLMGPAELDHERRFKLEQKASCLYRKLWQAQKILGMRLPVYILVTKCDEIAGFTSFCQQLPEKLHKQIFGWSNSATIETAYKPELATEAFASIHANLAWLQYEIYALRDEIQDADDLFLFPPAIQSMRAPLEVYLEGLFKQSTYHESYLFRGLYFCGEAGAETVTEIATQPQAEGDWTKEVDPLSYNAPQQTALAQRNPIFLADLFKEKIFSESVLAQPIRRTAISRNRTVLVAQILSLAILLLGGGALAVTYGRLAGQERDLHRFLNEVEGDLQKVEASYEHIRRPPSDELAINESTMIDDEQMLHSGETRLLSGMAAMNGRRFRTVFIPTSWFSSINDRLERSIAAAFEFVIFESLRVDLERRAKTLLSSHFDYSTSPVKNVSFKTKEQVSANEAQDNDAPVAISGFQLHSYVEELGEFRVNLDRYDRLIGKDPNSLSDLRQLVLYLNHTPLPENFDKNNTLYQQAMVMAHGKPIENARFYKESATRVGDLIEDLYAASFDRRGAKYEYLNDIVETEGLLERPEYTWLSTFVFDPHSPFHGMTLSSGLSELKRALQDLRREELLTREPPDLALPPADLTRYQHLVRRVLIWDQDALRQAITLHEQYESFVETKSYERREYLDNSVKEAARTRLKARMRKLFQQARRYQPVGPAAEGSALRASLVNEIKNLQEAQPTLSEVLKVSTPLGIDGDLRSALSGQVSYLLRSINREFAAQRFYVMKQPDFSWWDGRQPVSYVAYDLSTPDDVPVYLTIQRKNIATLARDFAVPVLQFSASQNISAQTSSVVDWNEILTDLDAFDNKQPGNPLASLETFIMTDMDRVAIDTCSGVPSSPDGRSKDYFLAIRNSIRLRFYSRCTSLARLKAVNEAILALNNYREIEAAFNKSLSGGFPFTEMSKRPGFPDLDPSALLQFFHVFDSKEKAAKEALIRSADFGATPQQATEFLAQMGRVREFFAPFLEKKQGPVFDCKVQLRVNREQEIGANQIVDWTLQVGQKKFSYLSEDLNGQWIFGDPIVLTLRWANDSPTVPVTTFTPAAVIAKDRVAVFEYNDRWSLFTLLLKHGDMLKRAGTPAECDQGFDPEPYTLKFTIRTDPDPAAQQNQRSDLKNSTAEVFLRLSLVTANKQEPLTLPCFPKTAPPVPSIP